MSVERTSDTGLTVRLLTPGSSPAELFSSLARHLRHNLGLLMRAAAARRTLLFLVGDVLVSIAASLVTVYFCLGARLFILGDALLIGAAAAGMTVAANVGFGNYRLAWVTFSLDDLRRLFGAVAIAVLALSAVASLPQLQHLAHPHPVVLGAMLFLALAAFRGSRRILTEPVANAVTGRRTLVVMPSRHAYFLPNVLRRMQQFRYSIVGIVDPDPSQAGSFEQGIEVLGTPDDIEALVERYRVEVVLVLLGASPGFSLGDFYARLRRLEHVEVKTMPSLTDIIEDRSDIGALERLCIHELTGRSPVEVDALEMRRVFGGRRVLVTGAGGSIGSELCRQLARFGPACIVLFERDDSNLFGIDRDLRQSQPGTRVVPFLGDITYPADVNRAFQAHRPEVVFHAAAYKHVPILEFHPDDALRVNVVGTNNVAQAALRSGTECFVYISTDKAVNPTSVMGASKRLGEMLSVSMNGLGDMRAVAVRFGNVLDSRGSVTTVFREAVARRQPLTVTHVDMKRYFMLTSEAVLLVLQAAALGQGGEVFVLDMGEPVSIWSLAHRMVELAGLRPDVDVPIVVTGPRPGEKLFEELLTAEEGTVATGHDRIRRARISRSYCYPDVLRAITGLETEAAGLGPADIKHRIAALVGCYVPDRCTGLAPSCHLTVAAA